MKPIYLILSFVLLTGCLKADIKPMSSVNNISNIKTDSTKNIVSAPKADAAITYDWYNGTTGNAVIKVTCKDCNAIATIGNATIPFIFNDQGVGQLKYTPVSGLSVHIAVCPGEGVKSIKADILDSSNTVLYTYSGVSGNWNSTYIIK